MNLRTVLMGRRERIEKPKVNFLTSAEIPIGFQSNGTIIALPVGTTDQNNIGICGPRGLGKTTLLQRLEDYHKNICEHNVVVLNDLKAETFAWKYPNDNEKIFNIVYQLRLGQEEQPMGLPIKTLAPAYSVSERTKVVDEIFSPRLDEVTSSEAWSCILRFEEFPSAKYLFDSICHILSECSTLDEMRETIESDPDINRFTAKAIMLRIRTFMRHSKKEKTFPVINNPEMEPKIPNLETIAKTIEKGYVPSIVSYYAQFFEMDYWHFHLCNIIDFLFKKQVDAINHLGKVEGFGIPMHLAIDEITGIANTMDQRHGGAKSLQKLFWRGRSAQFGVDWCAQDYAKVPSFVRNQTNYFIIFQQRGKNNMNALMNDLGLSERIVKNLPQLGKFEFYCVPKDNKIILITQKGVRYETDRIMKGMALPSLSKHLESGETIGG